MVVFISLYSINLPSFIIFGQVLPPQFKVQSLGKTCFRKIQKKREIALFTVEEAAGRVRSLVSTDIAGVFGVCVWALQRLGVDRELIYSVSKRSLSHVLPFPICKP